MSDPQYDVIIAGAGIAGATLALALDQAGLRTVLIDPVVFDAQVAPTFDGRASAIAYAAFRQWRARGPDRPPPPPAPPRAQGRGPHARAPRPSAGGGATPPPPLPLPP